MLLSALVDGTKATVGMEAGESALRGHRDYNCFTEYDRIMSLLRLVEVEP